MANSRAAKNAEAAASKNDGTEPKAPRTRMSPVDKARKLRDNEARKVEKLQKKIDSMQPAYEKATADLALATSQFAYFAAHPLLADESASASEADDDEFADDPGESSVSGDLPENDPLDFDADS